MHAAPKAFDKTLVASPERQQEADSDWSLVQRVQSGDVAAFDLLMRKYRERVYSVVYNMTSNRDDAADLTQDAFIKAFQSINRFQGQSSFFTWLYRIAQLTDKTGVEREVFVKELQEKLNEAMQKLSIKHRTVVTLFEIDGLSHEEIAEVVGCSVGTIRSRLHYAKQLLQSELQPYLRT